MTSSARPASGRSGSSTARPALANPTHGTPRPVGLAGRRHKLRVHGVPRRGPPRHPPPPRPPPPIPPTLTTAPTGNGGPHQGPAVTIRPRGSRTLPPRVVLPGPF